jgi:hypothetical protein
MEPSIKAILWSAFGLPQVFYPQVSKGILN